jgi:hypothetical protein
VISFEVLKPDDVPAAVVAMIEAAARCGPHDFEIGPMDDKALLSQRLVYVQGADEVEGAELLATTLEEAGVAYRAID